MPPSFPPTSSGSKRAARYDAPPTPTKASPTAAAAAAGSSTRSDASNSRLLQTRNTSAPPDDGGGDLSLSTMHLASSPDPQGSVDSQYQPSRGAQSALPSQPYQNRPYAAPILGNTAQASSSSSTPSYSMPFGQPGQSQAQQAKGYTQAQVQPTSSQGYDSSTSYSRSSDASPPPSASSTSDQAEARKNWIGQSKPAFAASRDSIGSAMSAAYYSAEEDIAGNASAALHSEPYTPPQTAQGASVSSSSSSSSSAAAAAPAATTAAAANGTPATPTSPTNPDFTNGRSKSKKSRKAKQKEEPPPSPLISPRRASLGKIARPPVLDEYAAAAAATIGANPSSRQGGDLSNPSPSMRSLGLAPGSPLSAERPLSTAEATPRPSASASTSAAATPRHGYHSRQASGASSSIKNRHNGYSGAVPASPTNAAGPSSSGADGLGLRLGSASQSNGSSRADNRISQDITQAQRHSTYSTDTGTNRDLLQRWILSIGIVNFDLEKGPDLVSLSPPLDISKEERDNIAFLSFPDTSIFDEGDTSFSFRIREVPLHSSVSSPPKFATTKVANAERSPRPEPNTMPRANEARRVREASDPGHGAARSLWGAFSGNRSSGRDQTATLSPNDAATTLPNSKSYTSIRQPAGDDGDAQEVMGSDTSSLSSAEVANASVSTHGRSVSATGANSVRSTSQHANGLTSSVSTTALSSQPSSSNVAGQAQNGVRAAGKIAGSTSSSYIYGFTYFRQRRDASIKRGYFQKSVVILSHLPYVALFGHIISKLGPLYYEHGDPIIEAFLHGILKWPSPSPGATLPLPLFGAVLWVSVPLGRQSQTSNATDAILPPPDDTAAKRPSAALLKKNGGMRSQVTLVPAGTSEEEPVLASIPPTPIISVFKEALADMWLIWECVLLAEPILVLGPDPKSCSEAVWHLLDICRPIPHAGDFRPFFTIHDYDFNTLTQRSHPPAGTIIGCTNPFMAQACSNWPHVLRVGKAAVKFGTAGKYGKGGNVKPPVGGGVAGGAAAGGGGPEHIPGFSSKRKRRVSKDRALLKKLVDMVEKEDNVTAANAMLRRYFADITERFLSPLNRYVSSLIPASGLSGGDSAAKIKPFNTDAFLASLKAHGTPLPLRSRSLPTASTVRAGLYLDFLRSPNFSFYLTERIEYYKTRDPVPAASKTRFEQQK